MLNVTALTGFGAGGESSHQYWRLANMIGPLDGGISVNIAELIFKDAAGTNLITSVGGAGSASGAYSVWVATRAFDGNAATAWMAQTAAPGSWLRFIFNQPVAVAQFSINSGSDTFYPYGPYTFDLQYSDDNALWVPVKSYTTGTNGVPWSQNETRNFTV